MPKAAQLLADKLGLRLEVFDSETKADRQIAAIENFVSKGAQAIAICVIDPKVLLEEMDRLYNRQLKAPTFAASAATASRCCSTRTPRRRSA